MAPDANWPAIKNPLEISEADHAAHRSPKGVPWPHDLAPGLKPDKHGRLLLKIAMKTHPRVKGARRKKKE